MFERHDKSTAVINASVSEVFAHLDDQTRLSAHMSKWCTRQMVRDAQRAFADRTSLPVGSTGTRHG